MVKEKFKVKFQFLFKFVNVWKVEKNPNKKNSS